MWEQKDTSKPECVKSCGRVGEMEKVFIDYYVLAKINVLMKKYTNIEWLCYLMGRDNVVEDLYIPKQKVSSARVDDIEAIPEIPIIGVIHSHHGLGLHSFSGVDHDYINDNHDLSILVWHDKTNGGIGINGQKKVTLQCGATMVRPISIEFFHPELNAPEWEASADENIKEATYTTTYSPPGVGYTGPYSPGYRGAAQAAEKKNGRSSKSNSAGWNVPGRNGPQKIESNYDDFLDQLVYDEGFVGLGGPDSELNSERPEAEVEEHFERIERNECGITKLHGETAVGATPKPTVPSGWVVTESGIATPATAGYLGVNRHNIDTFPRQPEILDDEDPLENPWDGGLGPWI